MGCKDSQISHFYYVFEPKDTLKETEKFQFEP